MLHILEELKLVKCEVRGVIWSCCCRLCSVDHLLCVSVSCWSYISQLTLIISDTDQRWVISAQWDWWHCITCSRCWTLGSDCQWYQSAPVKTSLSSHQTVSQQENNTWLPDSTLKIVNSELRLISTKILKHNDAPDKPLIVGVNWMIHRELRVCCVRKVFKMTPTSSLWSSLLSLIILLSSEVVSSSSRSGYLKTCAGAWLGLRWRLFDTGRWTQWVLSREYYWNCCFIIGMLHYNRQHVLLNNIFTTCLSHHCWYKKPNPWQQATTLSNTTGARYSETI